MKPTEEAIKFAQWINNNWYEPYGMPNNWRKETDRFASTIIYQKFTTEQLYDIYKTKP